MKMEIGSIRANTMLLIFLLFFLLTPNSYAQKITKISYGGTASSSGAYVGCVAMAEIINKAVPILFGMVIVIEKKVSIGKDVEDLPIIEIKGGGMRMGKGQRYALA